MGPAAIQTPPSRCHAKKQAATLEREFLSCPVTALAFLHDPASAPAAGEGGPGAYLLAGEDTQLKVYEAQTGVLCGELRAFESSVVHGIAVAPGAERVLLWGGASVAVIPGRVIRAMIEGRVGGDGRRRPWRGDGWCPNEATAPDWIYDGILDGGSPERGVLVTAHNEMVPFWLLDGPADGRGSPSVSFGAVVSPSRPILYSANVCCLGSVGGPSGRGDNGDEVLVAGGTVFGEIVVWKCRPWDEGGGGATEVLYVLSGHEGSVFGVTISEELTLPGRGGEKVRLLASCSDDRTVRIWDITDRAGGVMPARRAGKLLAESRETGFGGDALEHHDGPQTGSAKDGAAGPKEQPLKALAVAMGHQSRIWHVRFSTRGLLPPVPEGDCGGGQEPSSSSSRLTVYSFGEDATTQEWLLTLGRTEGIAHVSGALSHVNTVPCHGGKHIWSTAVLGRAGGGEPLIATGGADGKIALLGPAATLAHAASPVEPTPPSPDVVDVSFAFSDVSPLTGSTGATAHKAKGETFKTFAFVSESDILVTSTFGNVFVGHVQDDDDSRVSWAGLELPGEVRSDLRGYNIVRGPARNQSGFCFLGSTSGAVYMFSSNPVSRLEKITGLGRKVSDIFVLPSLPKTSNGSSTCTPDAHLHLIVTLLGHDEAFFITIAHQSKSTSVAEVVAVTTQSIPLPSGCVITAANLSGGLLSLGSRDGELLFFRNRLHGQASDDAGGAWQRIQSSPETTRSKDAITSLVRLPGTASGDVSPYILATCRDGNYMIYELETRTDGLNGRCGQETISLDLVHDSSPPFGPVITEAWFEEGEEGGQVELMLCGFRSRYFVVWNETRQREVATVDCGGVHRTYAYVTRRRDAARPGAGRRRQQQQQQEWVRFAYSKAQRTHMYTQQGAGHIALRTGTHGREIRAASWCHVAPAHDLETEEEEGGRLLATAAEDTTVRIWRYEAPAADRGGGALLRCAASLSAHTAGLQSLRWCGGGGGGGGGDGRHRYLVSSAGNEELFIWRVSRLDGRSRYGGLAVVREAAYPDRTADGDLRILSVDASEEGGGGGGSFVVSLVLSNSEVKTYRYSRELGFVLLARGMYTGACLTQVRHLWVHGEGGLGLLPLRVLTASTDGSVVVWGTRGGEGPAPAEYVIKSVHGLHQSSIKGLDVWAVPAEGGSGGAGWVVLTTGDDNALGILQLHEDDAADNNSNRPQNRRAIVRSAHAAGITGIRAIKSALPGEVLAATVSNDQRVKLWRVRGLGSGKEKGLKVELVQDKYSAVADAGDLALSTDGKLVITGVGVEVWKMDLGEEDH
ncbi:hypothetical protein RB593_007784 [Gaeumannomyces tritici]